MHKNVIIRDYILLNMLKKYVIIKSQSTNSKPKPKEK